MADQEQIDTVAHAALPRALSRRREAPSIEFYGRYWEIQAVIEMVLYECVDEPDCNDGAQNDHPIRNLNARYRCFPAKPFHDFPPR
jgi:hypothetical protein